MSEISVVHQKLHTWFKVIPSLESKFNTQKHCFNSQKHSALKQQIMAAYVHCLDTQAKQFMTDTKLQCYF